MQTSLADGKITSRLLVFKSNLKWTGDFPYVILIKYEPYPF